MNSFKGRNENVVYETTKTTKWGFRPYVLADLNCDYTYFFKLLENVIKAELGKKHRFITEL